MRTNLELNKEYQCEMWNGKILIVRIACENIDSLGDVCYDGFITRSHSETAWPVGDKYTVYSLLGGFDHWIPLDSVAAGEYSGTCSCDSLALLRSGCSCKRGKPCTCTAFDIHHFGCRCSTQKDEIKLDYFRY